MAAAQDAGAAPSAESADALRAEGNENFKGALQRCAAAVAPCSRLVAPQRPGPPQPTSPRSFCGPARAAKHFALAVMLYTRAIEADPSVAASYGNRAFAHIKLENYGAAVADAEAALRLDPNYVKAYYRRAPPPRTRPRIARTAAAGNNNPHAANAAVGLTAPCAGTPAPGEARRTSACAS